MVCSETRTSTFLDGQIVLYRPARLSVCLVSKAASTVWLRFLKLLHNKDKSSTQVLSIDKWHVHHKYSRKLERLQGDDIKSATQMTKILTARNPYTRLWSAYVDKFHFPGFFAIGREIIEKYRPNATAREIACSHNVTFEEFIKFVIGERNRRGPSSSHWLPVSEICGPCELKPDFIVKQETLGQDIKAILEHVGLSDDVGDFFTNKKEETTLDDELDVHFRGFLNVNNCMSETQYLRKIWQGLLINGYIQPRAEFGDLFEKLPFNLTVVLDTVRALRKRYVVDKQMTKHLRHMAMVKAYEQISTKKMAALQKLYEVDFKMFNYNRDIFAISNANQR